MVVVSADCSATVTVDGDALNENVPTGMVSVTVVVAVREPEVPVMVTV